MLNSGFAGAALQEGTDVLIEAIARCVRSGVDLTAVIAGDGKYRPALMALAERIGISSRIQFVGQVTEGKPVRDILDKSDLFVLPSRTEGLPRAMIEAMARGLPCIGSAVGGIPELTRGERLGASWRSCFAGRKDSGSIDEPFANDEHVPKKSGKRSGVYGLHSR